MVTYKFLAYMSNSDSDNFILSCNFYRLWKKLLYIYIEKVER